MADTPAAAQGAAGADAAPGMPQLDFTTFPNQIFWLVITLVAIYFVLTKMALPQISGILANRQGTITNDIAAAEELKLKAQAAEEAFQKAQAEARAEAIRISKEAKAEVQKEVDAAIAKADAEIAAKTAESEKRIAEIRDGAAESIEAVARDTAGAIVTAMGGPVDDEAVARAVGQRMKG